MPLNITPLNAVLNYSNISIKLQADSNILVSPEAGRDNCLPYVLAPPSRWDLAQMVGAFTQPRP